MLRCAKNSRFMRIIRSFIEVIKSADINKTQAGGHEMTKGRVFFRIIVGGYLGYLGIDLIKKTMTNRPENATLYLVLGVAFAVLGIVWCAKAVVMAVKHEYVENDGEELDCEELLESDVDEDGKLNRDKLLVNTDTQKSDEPVGADHSEAKKQEENTDHNNVTE